MTEHHLLSPYNWICGMFSKFVMVNSNDKKQSAGECFSMLGVLSALSPLSLVDMLQATCEGFGTWLGLPPFSLVDMLQVTHGGCDT